MKTPVCNHKNAVAKLREVILSLKRKTPKKSENSRNERGNDSCDTRARSVTRVVENNCKSAPRAVENNCKSAPRAVENNCKSAPRANEHTTKPSIRGDTWSNKISLGNRRPKKRYSYRLKCKKLAKQFKNSLLVISKKTTLRSINNTIIISTTQHSHVRDLQLPLCTHAEDHREIEGNNVVITTSELLSKERVENDNKIDNQNVVSSSTLFSIDNTRRTDNVCKEDERNVDLIVSASNTIHRGTQKTEHNDSTQVQKRVLDENHLKQMTTQDRTHESADTIINSKEQGSVDEIITITLGEATLADSKSKDVDEEQESHHVESKMEKTGKVCMERRKSNESDEDMFQSLAAVYDDPYVFDESDEEIESYKGKEMVICPNIEKIELGTMKANINCKENSSDRGKKAKKYRRISMYGETKSQVVPATKSKVAKRSKIWNLNRFIKRPKSSNGRVDGDSKENDKAKRKSLKKKNKSVSKAIKNIGKSEVKRGLSKNAGRMKGKGIRTSDYRVPAEIEVPILHSKGYGSKKTLEVVEKTESKVMNSVDRKETKEFYVAPGTCNDSWKSNSSNKISRVSPTSRRSRDQLSQNLAMLSKYSIPVTIEINLKSKYDPDHACRKLIQQTLDNYIPVLRSKPGKNTRATMVRKPIADISNSIGKPIKNTRSTNEDNIKFLKLKDDDDNDSVNGTIIPPSISIYSDSEMEMGKGLNGVEAQNSNRSCKSSIRKDIMAKIHNWNVDDFNF